MALGSTQPLMKMSTRNIPGGKGRRCLKMTTYHNTVPLSRNLGSLTSQNPLGPFGPVTEQVYVFTQYGIINPPFLGRALTYFLVEYFLFFKFWNNIFVFLCPVLAEYPINSGKISEFLSRQELLILRQYCKLQHRLFFTHPQQIIVLIYIPPYLPAVLYILSKKRSTYHSQFWYTLCIYSSIPHAKSKWPVL